MSTRNPEGSQTTVAEQFERARELTVGGLAIALGVLVPIVFHAIGGGRAGSTFLPMYLPVIACGMLVSPGIAAAVGLITPALSSALTGMPPVLPVLPLMVVELAALGALASLLHRRLKLHVIPATALALLGERVVMGLAVALVVGLLPADLSGALPPPMRHPLPYVIGATVTALPGLALQLVVVPVIVAAVERTSLLQGRGS